MSTGYEIVRKHLEVPPGETEGRQFEYALDAPDGKRIVLYEGYSSTDRLAEDGSSAVFWVYSEGPWERYDPIANETIQEPGRTRHYDFTIVCVNAGATSAPAALPAPAAFRTKVNTNRTVALAWQPVPGAAGYRLYEAVNSPGGVATVQDVTSTRGPLAPGSYEYFVRAVDSEGRESADSVHAVVTVVQA